MKFNPIKKEIYTDNEEFIKKLNCPYKINQNNLKQVGENLYNCSNCNHLIVDTKCMSDEELLKIISREPKTCLKIDLNQNNVKIISHVISQSE